jgi:hypothetical protein
MSAVVYRSPTTKRSGSELPAEPDRIITARAVRERAVRPINDFRSLKPQTGEVLGANERKSAGQKSGAK